MIHPSVLFTAAVRIPKAHDFSGYFSQKPMKMPLIQLNLSSDAAHESKTKKAIERFRALMDELTDRELPDAIIARLNPIIDEANQLRDKDSGYRKKIYKSQTEILRILQKELNWVTKNHYQNMGMLFGMALFGIPLGTTFGVNLGNFAFLGVGIPVGMVVGMAIGASMDSKAKKEGRQINIDSLF